MKKLILSAMAVFAFGFANAQSTALSEGSWLVEANTNFGAGSFGGTALAHSSNTSFSFTSVSDAFTSWSLGGEAGYFIMDNLAIKAGLGYGSFKPEFGNDISTFSYKLGAKYYIMGQFPVQVDYTGASIKDADENPSFVGLQAGYAWFVADNISIEPGIRYALTMNEDAFAEDVLQLNIGFALHF